MPVAREHATLSIAGHEVSISNPSKVLFPDAGITKLDVVHYYLAVAEGALRGAGDRPNVLVRYANGITGEFFYQKRAPAKRPPWVDVCTIAFPSGRTADEVVPRDAATLAWMANLGCLELHPHPVRTDDLEHPDELRVDLDPMPGIPWSQIVTVAGLVRDVLADVELVGWPKTSGSRGIHVNVRIARRWTFGEVRRAALALAREVERRAPELVTSRWWKEERHGVFIDYNQNAKDRTVASAYSIRPKPDARVSAPLTWGELESCRLEEFTLRTMPARFAQLGDRHVGIDDAVCSLEALLELSRRQEADGLGDAPWPPHYAKQGDEPARVAPSRARRRMRRRASPSAEPALGVEDRRQLVRRSDLELVVATVSGLAIRSPPQKRRRVPEAIALQVIVLHLTDPLDPQRLPRQILAGGPPALRAGHALRLGRSRPPNRATGGPPARRGVAAPARRPAPGAAPS